MQEEFLWVEKYRPKTVQETILPDELKETFQEFVNQNNVPNLLLSGSAGVGKTTIATAMLNEIGSDYIIVNGSMDGNIDTLRVRIQNFASTVSFAGGRKYVILDEADYLSRLTQPALRNFMEEFSKNCGFILTCNLKDKIIPPLQSRCSGIDFKFKNSDKPKLAASFFKRACSILDAENVGYDKRAVAEIIQVNFPDFRRALNEMQRYSVTGKIDAGILANHSEENFDQLIDFLKTKNFTEMRKWVAVNADIDSAMLYRTLYDILPKKLNSSQEVANAIIIMAEYQYKEAFVANSEINRAAALATLMAEMVWK